MPLSLDSALTIASLDPLTLDPPPEEYRQRLLSFPLGTARNSSILLDRISEIVRVDAVNILTVPETPGYVLGIYNWRGEMLWLADLAQMVGFAPSIERANAAITPIAIVIQVDGQSVGLTVPAINDIELRDLNDLLPANSELFPAALVPFLAGYLADETTVLDADAIAQFLIWQQRATV